MKIGFLGLFGMVLSLRAYQCANTADTKSLLQNMTDARLQFALNLLQVESTHLNLKNFAMSPFSTWSLMVMLYEGADGSTLKQIRDVLGIYVDYPTLRKWYEAARVYHYLNSENTKLFSLRYAYYDDVGDIEFVKGYNSVVLRGVGEENVVLQEGRPRGVDFDQGASIIINDDIDKASHGEIYSSYSRRSFNNTVTMLGITVSYFKAKWKYPFDKSQTNEEQFSDSSGKPAGKVDMMVQTGKFAYAENVKGLQADVLELPFGEHDLVMIFILPKPSYRVSQVLTQLKNLGLQPLLEKLDASKNESDVEVKLPKIDTRSVLSLEDSVTEAGLSDLGDMHADLGRMLKPTGDRGVYLSFYHQFARIVVDEEGLPDAVPQKSSGTNNIKFHMTRPFAYLVLQRTHKLLIHSGVFREGEVE
ncbi:serine protease inhibitor 77Ba-like [Drosophila mauritiana]|uniref:Serine protease inhibitor 77Ba-like n=1 Tax=Drosophila mauritiana TaxID=7226 RepID=A0A6P8JQU1_DROMA|nr:serine protease inhibitor 77Ba-like [Drosophila mauritiana]